MNEKKNEVWIRGYKKTEREPNDVGLQMSSQFMLIGNVVSSWNSKLQKDECGRLKRNKLDHFEDKGWMCWTYNIYCRKGIGSNLHYTKLYYNPITQTHPSVLSLR